MKFSGKWTLPNDPFEKYENILELAIRNPDTFSGFKNYDDYFEIVGCDIYGAEGASVLADEVFRVHPELMAQIQDFQENDHIGAPPMFDTKIGRFSPNTLRYMCVLGDLTKHFGSLDNMDIIEVGSAYGGLCLIISKKYKFRSYTLTDIPNSIELSRKYLSHFPIENVIYQDSENVIPAKTDLFISNFAFTEFDYDGWDFYTNNIIAHSDKFYITTNILRNRTKDSQRYDFLYNKLSEFFDIEVHPEPPLRRQGTGIWVGKHK